MRFHRSPVCAPRAACLSAVPEIEDPRQAIRAVGERLRRTFEREHVRDLKSRRELEVRLAAARQEVADLAATCGRPWEELRDEAVDAWRKLDQMLDRFGR